MSGAAWTVSAIVVGGLLLAALKWVTAYATTAIAFQVVDKIGDSLQDRWKSDIDDALASVQDELSYNGGQTVKDMVRQINCDVETLLHET